MAVVGMIAVAEFVTVRVHNGKEEVETNLTPVKQLMVNQLNIILNG